MDTAQVATLALLRRMVVDGTAKRLRLEWGLSLGDVARALSTDPSTVWMWEERGRRPRADLATKYAELLGRLAEAGDDG
jgi:transcriptional regulator with XRE-family HTH domain